MPLPERETETTLISDGANDAGRQTTRAGTNGSPGSPSACAPTPSTCGGSAVFRAALGPFENTQAFLAPLLARLGRSDVCQYLEVETYTWDVLPAEHRQEPVEDAIARELAWTMERLSAP